MSPDQLAPDRSLEAMLDRLLRPLARATEDAVQRLGLVIETGPEAETVDPSDDGAAPRPTPARGGDSHRPPAADTEAGPVHASAGAVGAGTTAPLAGASTNRGSDVRPLHVAAAPAVQTALTEREAEVVGSAQAASAPPPTGGWPTPHLPQSVTSEAHHAERRIEAAPAREPGPVASRYESASVPPLAASSAAPTRPALPAPPATRESSSGIAPGGTTATAGLAPGAVPVAAAPDRPVGDGGGHAAEAFATFPAPPYGAAIEIRGMEVAAPLAAPDRHVPPRAVAAISAGDAATGAASPPPPPPPTRTPPSAGAGAAAPASSRATPTVVARVAAVRDAAVASGLLRLVRAPAAEGAAALPDNQRALASAAGPVVPSASSPSSTADPAAPLPQAPSRALRSVATRLDRALAPVFSRAAAATWAAESAQADDASGASSPTAAEGSMNSPDGTPATQINNTFNVKVSMAGNAGGNATDPRQLEEQLADWLRASARRQGLLA